MVAPVMTRELGAHSFTVAFESRLGQAYSEQAFRYLLAMERKRSRRSGCAFVLALIYGIPAGVVDEAFVPTLFSALWVSLRETDCIGWYRDGRVVAAVLPELKKPSDLSLAPLIRTRILDALAAALPPDVARAVRVRVYRVAPKVKP